MHAYMINVRNHTTVQIYQRQCTGNTDTEFLPIYPVLLLLLLMYTLNHLGKPSQSISANYRMSE